MLVRLTEEPLNLKCEWNNCSVAFSSWQKFNIHLVEHAKTKSGEFNIIVPDKTFVLLHRKLARYLLIEDINIVRYFKTHCCFMTPILSKYEFPTSGNLWFMILKFPFKIKYW